jgi:ribosomal protein L37AE/L43A
MIEYTEGHCDGCGALALIRLEDGAWLCGPCLREQGVDEARMAQRGAISAIIYDIRRQGA